jgi:hypothetical protein
MYHSRGYSAEEDSLAGGSGALQQRITLGGKNVIFKTTAGGLQNTKAPGNGNTKSN